ncbi:PilZ domain-containing protein [Croceicoccus ponticola]|uniref:PilZ domain-containing protein n=1 Tax=Croceicoccus ponticola TaxID=2217664 RepID=A0A437H0V8_9SPHN|nr:PilZ domain-containing protein [Croceicoccus ponticola]RVQ69284.1 PilZ domain-containing protein [Croceicoccus ponticola]
MAHRYQHRSRVRIPAGYRTDKGDEIATSVIDISERGCRLRSGVDLLKPGEGLSIAIGNLAPVSAQVQWQYGSFCGLSFVRPLDTALLDHLRHAYVRGALPLESLPRP